MKRKTFRVIISAVLCLTLALSMATVTSFGASKSAPKIEDVDYEGKGRVEVEFYGKVKYKKTKVTVKDSSGKAYSASITKKDNDDLKFKVKKYKTGKKYTFTISGIKKSSARSYAKVNGTFKIKAPAPLKIKEAEYDFEDSELSAEFNKKVAWGDAKVAVTDASGTEFPVQILEKDNDDVDVSVDGLTYGEKYTIKISGVKAKGASNYTTVKKVFRAIDD